MWTSDLEQRGLRLWIAGDKLRVAPREKVTPDVVNFIREHREEIMSELKSPLIYHNPYPQGTLEARQESLMQCMEATWQPVFNSVKEAYEGKQRQFKATPGLRKLERRIEVLQQAALQGEAKLSDFSIAAHEWERAAKAELN